MMTVDPLDFSIAIDRGDDQELEVTITDKNGAVLNVSAGTFKCTVKANLGDPIGSAMFQLTSPGGIDLTQAASGIVVVNFPSSLLETMAGEFVYDLQMTLAGKVRTLIKATRFNVDKDVTDTGVAGQAAGGLGSFPNGVWIKGFFYVQDQADNFNTKWRVYNRNWELVGASLSDPPF